jgi:imidazolonepropionase-like amidohydrolase
MFTLATSDQIATRHANRASFDRTDSADVWSAGNGVTPPGGHPTAIAKGAGMELRTLAEGMDAAAFIKTQVDEGSDYIKIFQEDGGALNPKPTLPRFADHRLKQLIDLSHSTGRKAIVHVSKMSDARDAFQFGADAIAHMWMDQESPTQSAMLSAGFKKIHPDLLERSLRNVRRLHRAGVTILAGTDASNPGTAHGPSIHEEMELLVRAGMTPSEAIAASTAKPAAFFGTADRGRIATGLRADLLLVDGDPTVDIKATRRIVGIWKNGYPVDRAKLPVIPSMPGAK